jgi:hypothetical protein
MTVTTGIVDLQTKEPRHQLQQLREVTKKLMNGIQATLRTLQHGEHQPVEEDQLFPMFDRKA